MYSVDVGSFSVDLGSLVQTYWAPSQGSQLLGFF